MVNSTATAGNVIKGGNLFLHDFGTDNTFIGKNAGNLTTSGQGRNVALGGSALENNTVGADNTAIGWRALLHNTTGSDNTATGITALQSNTTGYQNTANGEGALAFNTIGYNNTACGAGALVYNTTGATNTATGARVLQYSTTGGANTGNGADALLNSTTGSNNTAIGYSALQSNTVGTGNSALGFFADVSQGDLVNATAIGNGAIVNGSNKVRVGNTAVTVIEGQVGFTASSDVHEKENFEPVDGEEVLGKIGELSLTSWNFIGHDPKEFRHYGPMAQDFFAAFGHDGIGSIGTETTITSTDMDGILMIAAQALEKRTEALRAENAELKARLQALERRIGRTKQQ